METPLTITEKIICAVSLLIGFLLSIQAIEGYITSCIIYHDGPDSYQISVATYVSNLINGNLLIVSSLLFLRKKSLGALVFQYAGIMFMLYAINYNLFDFIIYGYFD